MALTLMLSAAAGAAGPAEPLQVTRLPDSETELLISAGSDDTTERNAGEFSRAISDAVREQQRSMQANCRSVPAAGSSTAVRWAWESRCRYKRY